MNGLKNIVSGESHSLISDYIALTKPGLTFVSVSTSVGGAFLGLQSSTNYFLLIQVFLGAYLAGAGAGILNNYLERDLDARMTRTGLRPLPAKKISSRNALYFGILLSIAGILFLTYFTTFKAGVITCVTLFVYLGVYTPLKRITPLALYIGGLSGALPPLIGIAAVTNDITNEGLLLFLILFLWQIPHFLSLAWIHREDYERAGYKVSTVIDPSGSFTCWQILVACLLLVPVSILPTLVKSAGLIYAIVSLSASLYFLLRGIIFYRKRTIANAKKIFIVSIIYIPILFLTLVVDKLSKHSLF